jgi:predicted phosphodiesterase
MSRSNAVPRVAVIADVHANALALDAVLEELERERSDVLVVGGDVASGPEPNETLKRLMALERARFVRGNGDREVVEAFDDGRPFDPEEQDWGRKAGAWVAQRITRPQRDFLGSFEDRVVLSVAGLGEVLFCHGSPGSDEEIMTSLTPEPALRRMLDGINQRVVVCGHTHVQFDRMIHATRVINAGSVGMAYEGRRGAFWLALGPDAELRRTDYDYEQAARRFVATQVWDAENACEIILKPPDPREAEEFFEKLAAERGER